MKIYVGNISHDLARKKGDILKNARELFPKTSEQGRLEVELGARSYQ